MFNWYPGQTLASLEREAITQALTHFNGNNASVARALGVSERTVYERIQEYKMSDQVKEMRAKKSRDESGLYLKLQRGQISNAEYRDAMGLEPSDGEYLHEGTKFSGLDVKHEWEGDRLQDLERDIPAPEAARHG